MRPIFAALFATISLFAVFQFSGSVGAGKLQLFPAYDFGLFYCAGRALDQRANPYTVEPLRSCEKRIERSGTLPDTVVEPAPLPGYSLAVFAVLGFLPFAAAKLIWLFIECLALVASTMLLARMTRLPTVAIFVLLFLAEGLLSITWGQLPPLAIAGLVAAAYFLRERRDTLAAMAAALALVEPHLGLPAVLALFIWVPRARLALSACLVLLGLVHFVILGWDAGLGYFTAVLPGMARSELTAADQFSLTWLMHYLGASDSVALLAGSISYALMLLVGLLVGAQAAARRNDKALLVLLPPAIVLIGGSYVHQIQMAAALPAALVLASASAGRLRVLLLSASVVLAVPWFSMLDSRLLLVCGPVVVFLFVSLAIGTERIVTRLSYGLAASLVCCGLLVGLLRLPHGAQPSRIAQSAAPVRTSLASSSWESYLRSNPKLSSQAPRVVVSKVPTWGALLLLLLASTSIGFASQAQRRKRPAAA